jgi:alkylresorcinol/alkylpyrone synthase
MRAVLTALATANPARYATQAEACRALETQFELDAGERDLYHKLLLDGPIKGRYVAMTQHHELRVQDPDALLERFSKHSRAIAADAARKALETAHLQADDVDAVMTNTCTGYLCPGLSSYVVEDLGLRGSVAVFDLVGMGCGAAIPNLECAARLIQAGAKQTVLSIAVEICSATFFRGPDPDLAVSNSIFGDGAAATVLQSSANGTVPGLLEFLDFESAILPKYREQLRYRHEGGRLRNALSKSVPVIGARAIAQATRRLLARHDLDAGAIRWWAVHPGGTAVLERVEKKLDIPRDALRFSYEVFRDYGNMSSPSVLFVLDKVLREGRPEPHDKGLLLSFGAGFTAFAALVEFC